MTFFVTFIVLLIERFFDWGHLRHWYWYTLYEHWVSHRLLRKEPYMVLAAVIIPLLLVVWLVPIMLGNLLYGVANLLFQLIILIYCLGPQNLWADMFACNNALTYGDMSFATQKLKTSFGVPDVHSVQPLRRHFLEHIFIEANNRVFAVIFWFVLLGPVGACLYRAISLSSRAYSEQKMDKELAYIAHNVLNALDWLPVRLFTFIFALGGHFAKVFSCWSKKTLVGFNSNDMILTECGTAALGGDEQHHIPEDGSAERNAISLLDRSFIITLVLLLIVTLMF